ncbi:hypothetical protein M422DRAFT_240214 [Sphaerobolus stellatus SS14]|nr:hypothetical protein M422DRAFT_240214 [Sphaerobolus stellatus SS14]
MTMITALFITFFILTVNAHPIALEATTGITTPMPLILVEEALKVYAPRQETQAKSPSPSSTVAARQTQSTDESKNQIIETSQIFQSPNGNTTQVCTFTRSPTTLDDGQEAVIISKTCTSTFTPNANATAVQPGSTSTSTSLTTAIVTTPTSTSTSASEDTTPTTVSTMTLIPAPNPPSQADSETSASSTPEHDSSPSPSVILISPTISSISSVTPTPTGTSAAASQTPFSTASDTGHLSTLPIFLGAFGGIAGIALLTVGCMVYHPLRRINQWRLNPPACLRPRKLNAWNQQEFKELQKTGAVGADEKKLITPSDLESARNSEETRTSAQMSRWSADSRARK